MDNGSTMEIIQFILPLKGNEATDSERTWEKRSFHSERHFETSYVLLTAVFVADASFNALLKHCHTSIIDPYMHVQIKATVLAIVRTMRIGKYNISQSIQNIGYRIEFPAT